MANYKYKAFISYSHHDVTVARWLHRALEAYRPPRDRGVHASSSAHTGAFPLRPIFRDEDELVVSANLSDSLVEALQQSEFLIVICSPSSVSSKWASQEIIEFKKNRGASNVIAVIADGNPGNCFPEPLLREVLPSGELGAASMEPLAADLQGGRAARRLALLRVAASMLGVGLDQLVQREAQRRNRFLAAVATAAVLGMLVMGWLTFTAVTERRAADAARLIAEQSREIAEQSRQTAELRRREAEGLIEFMLGDLREKLQPVGRLDVLDAVGAKALDYYANQDQQTLSADSLGQRARALHLLGEISDKKGDMDAALDQFTLAAESTALLVRAYPEDPQRIFDHAQSVFWVGMVAYQQGRHEVARRSWAKYLNYAEQLVKLEPEKPEWLLEVVYGHSALGAIEVQEQRWQHAEEKFLNSLESLEELAQLDRPNLGELASTHSWLSFIYIKQKRFQLAETYSRGEVGALRALLDIDPGDYQMQYGLIVAQRGAAQVALAAGHIDAALALLEPLLEDLEKLIEHEPDDTEALQQQVKLLQDLVMISLFRGEVAAASEQASVCLERAQSLLQRDSSVLYWQVELDWKCRYLMASIAFELKKIDLSQELIDSFYDELLTQVQGETSQKEAQLLLGKSSFLMGDIFRAQGKPDIATEQWQHARALLEGEEEALEPEQIVSLIMVLRRLGDEPRALELITYLRTVNYQHPAFSQATSG
ncbi:MAG: toll/interleukin-1 receptor domain-containing protein [Halioglobus sp.]